MTESQQTDNHEPGGFFPPGALPSPAPSSLSTTSAAGLPRPRATPLRPGSIKENNVRRFMERQLLSIGARAIKRSAADEPGIVPGFRSMGELCKELDVILNLLWQTGTPSLQVPYLLNIANDLTDWLESLKPDLAPTFSALHKLDHFFASLVAGRDVLTGEVLPGFEYGPAMSRTDMVRCRSLAEQTRVQMVNVMRRASDPEEEGEEEGEGEGGTTSVDDAETTDGDTTMDDGDGKKSWKEILSEEDDDDDQMDVGRVYEKTLVGLGAELGDGPPIGIIV
ncbi:hypothetical protein GGTG_09725 [Gaeumannomyces tritici R3-111a-1]|uniref:Meiotic recombination protein DMC1 n=1 Tax=Gaeumannomyces tritici (strain R3-111a-1) TaxID=644352 RepID=J3P890_GAET3|nr:hypothetical protein GGTG_09725 [Gaeumannomyces tritici R3-111a-1]EJT72873.1 hypothetical protein GGTG_09725 [Gaeumannomyces tritici R3-111a-1]